MIIVIPSRGRHDTSLTLRRSIPASWRARTRVLVNTSEELAYSTAWPDYEVWTHAVENDIARVRQGAVERAGAEDDRVMMMDDDLQFYVRRQYHPPRLRDATTADIEHLLTACNAIVGPDIPLVSVSFRQHNDSTAGPYSMNGRADRVYALFVPVLRAIGYRYRFQPMENFDLALTLLRAGYPNLIWWHWANDQTTSNAPGGCSEYRTPELQAAAARSLAEAHGPFVTVKTGRRTKTSWQSFGGVRDDVICAWSAAFDAGRRQRGVAVPQPDVSPWLPKEALTYGHPSLF